MSFMQSCSHPKSRKEKAGRWTTARNARSSKRIKMGNRSPTTHIAKSTISDPTQRAGDWLLWPPSHHRENMADKSVLGSWFSTTSTEPKKSRAVGLFQKNKPHVDRGDHRSHNITLRQSRCLLLKDPSENLLAERESVPRAWKEAL